MKINVRGLKVFISVRVSQWPQQVLWWCWVSDSRLAGIEVDSHLCEGPVVGDADVGQPLLHNQRPTGALHNVHKVDVAISHLPHLRATPCLLFMTKTVFITAI